MVCTNLTKVEIFLPKPYIYKFWNDSTEKTYANCYWTYCPIARKRGWWYTVLFPMVVWRVTTKINIVKKNQTCQYLFFFVRHAGHCCASWDDCCFCFVLQLLGVFSSAPLSAASPDTNKKTTQSTPPPTQSPTTWTQTLQGNQLSTAKK